MSADTVTRSGDESPSRFTQEMEAAYQRGLEMSRREHGKQSTKITIEQSPMHEFMERTYENQARASFAAFRRPPDEIVEEYTSDDDAAAFCAGWMDGTDALPFKMRDHVVPRGN